MEDTLEETDCEESACDDQSCDMVLHVRVLAESEDCQTSESDGEDAGEPAEDASDQDLQDRGVVREEKVADWLVVAHEFLNMLELELDQSITEE